MTHDMSLVTDEIVTEMTLPRGAASAMGVIGQVTVELHDADGNLKYREVVKNLVTSVGDQLYASRGAGLTSSVLPVGMKLGTGSTAVAKTGAGAALVTYLTNSHLAFTTGVAASAGVATYICLYPAGKATSASTPITEVVIYTDTTADATSVAANTISRALLAGIASKQSTDTLTVTWTHTVLGA
jgi:hypothetical protein